MDLERFIVTKDGRKQLSFGDAGLINLEKLLNEWVLYPEHIDVELEKLYFISKNRRDKANREQRFAIKYWDDEYLTENNLDYGWFTIIECPDAVAVPFLECYMHHSEPFVFIRDNYNAENVTCKFSLTEFIDILEQWKSRDFGLEKPKVKKWWQFRK